MRLEFAMPETVENVMSMCHRVRSTLSHGISGAGRCRSWRRAEASESDRRGGRGIAGHPSQWKGWTPCAIREVAESKPA